ncbi:MAG TPA: AAA family ATPase [Chloroflexi bacterium]|nr:AAA family ATPase [Chloroflexota bacterium]
MTQRGRILLITGAIGSGKTTYCRAQIDAARRAGLDVAGVLSPARFAQGVKVGIDVLDLRSGELRELAHLRTMETAETASGVTGVVTQRWRFDAAALAWANQVLAQATPCDLLVVDELGPLELEQGRGWTAALATIDARAFDDALLVVRSSLLAQALARWPDAKVIPIEPQV